MQGDPELNYAHFALQRLRILPSDLNNMSQRERAFIYASIDLRVEEEKRGGCKGQIIGREVRSNAYIKCNVTG